ncbi:MAG: chemotaxis protein histidine kinase-like protein, partial [Firmicutes bacterium]|nr:chemotaxis protein histidine kinase-like protein [Bacillota bacterium]
MISVNVAKLDTLMDLVGELVVAEAMVIQNPDLRGLSLNNFAKAVRQLEKITGEMQDIVMSIRMLPLAATFQKMNRIIRDMCKKLGKEVQLELVGEETEVDKNIIEHISDPLMHIIRNAVDHGIESGEERIAAGKPANGKVTLEAKHDGSDVVILIKDDGRGLNRDKILKRARDNGLLHKPENEMTDKEIYSFIFAPGFSTNDKVTEFSGRGVGMDVVTKNITSIGGMVGVDSIP